MKIQDLIRHSLREMSSGGAVGGAAIGSTMGGLGQVADTVKKSKKKRKLKDGQAVLQR